MKFLKYNIGIIITAIFMAVMAYKEWQSPRYGKENVPLIYLLICVTLVLLLTLIYFRYFSKDAASKVSAHSKSVSSKPKSRR